MMVGMTPKEKIAVSLPPHLVKAAKTAVRKGRSANVSAYVADAMAEKAKNDDLRSLLDEMLEESGGPMTPAERRWADRVLDGSKKIPRKRR
jgi:Arc/MetJ-type ribon-helix-helix transcriptional regulator